MAKTKADKQKTDKLWYKPFIIPGVIALSAVAVVLFFVKGEIDRFTLIMPIFAGYILYMILTAVDDEEK